MCFQFVLIPKVVYRGQKRIQRAEQKSQLAEALHDVGTSFPTTTKKQKNRNQYLFVQAPAPGFYPSPGIELGFIPVQESNPDLLIKIQSVFVSLQCWFLAV